jgi:preprotein translocase subunit SecY
LTVAIPNWRAAEVGRRGRKKIAQIHPSHHRLGFLQAICLSMALQRPSQRNIMATSPSHLPCSTTRGHVDWRAHHREPPHRNGVSLLIFSGIIARVGSHFAESFLLLFNPEAVQGGLSNAWGLVAIIVLTLVLIAAVVFVDLGERRIPVQYAKRVVGRKMYGGQSTHIPLKVNSTGVMALIFGSAIMQFPSTILAFMGTENPAYKWWNSNVSYSSFWYQLIFALLIFGFTFFYTTISFNPNEISKNIQQNGGMIPGIRQGKPTADFLLRTSNRITLFAALFLALLATVPTLLSKTFSTTLPFGASSLLIAVSVAMETTRQLESQMLMRHYKGFLK